MVKAVSQPTIENSRLFSNPPPPLFFLSRVPLSPFPSPPLDLAPGRLTAASLHLALNQRCPAPLSSVGAAVCPAAIGPRPPPDATFFTWSMTAAEASAHSSPAGVSPARRSTASARCRRLAKMQLRVTPSHFPQSFFLVSSFLPNPLPTSFSPNFSRSPSPPLLEGRQETFAAAWYQEVMRGR
jgi:hypothetical protein